jgi:ankyrin repeat protein
VRVTKLLLNRGARPDVEDEDGQTPLSRAVEGGRVAVVQLLLAQEVELNCRYYIVSEDYPYLNRLIAYTVILDCCRV